MLAGDPSSAITYADGRAAPWRLGLRSVAMTPVSFGVLSQTFGLGSVAIVLAGEPNSASTYTDGGAAPQQLELQSTAVTTISSAALVSHSPRRDISP